MSEYNDETIEEPFEDEALDASPPASGQPPKSDYDPTVMKDSHGWFETCAATHSPLDEADG